MLQTKHVIFMICYDDAMSIEKTPESKNINLYTKLNLYDLCKIL